MDAHEFAFFLSDVSKLCAKCTVGDLFEVTDKDIVHRISNVVRMQPSQSCILFDQKVHVYCQLHTLSSKKIVCSLEKKEQNQIIKPSITIALPLLKREALQEAIYSAVELGVQEVFLIMTDKVQRKWGGDHEYERLHKIMVAAAEQSKNFTLPTLHAPILLSELLKSLHNNDVRIFFDADGQQAMQSIQSLQQHKNIILLIGPEGDLTEQEKITVNQSGFLSVALTPTVLRAQQALVVGAGLFRSLFR